MGETATVYALSFLGVIIMLLFALAVVGFYVFYQNRLLKQQHALIKLETQQQQRLIKAGVESQEAERQRIAHDLHDSIGVMLATSQLYIRELSTTESSRELQDKAIDLLDEVLLSIRTITRDLAPETLLHFGLVEAIEDIVQITNRLPGLTVYFQGATVERFAVSQELALFRIVQELFANTIKHAEASEIRIKLEQLNSGLQFTYRDNGKGLAAEWSKKQQGFGLQNIRSRGQFLNAELYWSKPVGGGFLLSLKFTPLPPVAEALAE